MDPRTLPSYRPGAPGARLDDQPWARSWPEFLAAVSDGRDASARQFIMNAWSERVPGEGGFLVPEQLRAQVMAYVTPAVVRPRAMTVPMGAYRLDVPVLDNVTQDGGGQALGGLSFGWYEDGETIASSNPEFGRAVLQASRLAALVGIPGEMESDAAGPLGDFISRVVALGMAWAEDGAFIAGSGVRGPQGVLNADCAVRVPRAAAGTVGSAEVAAMLSALHPAALAAGLTPGITGVGWIVSESVIADVLQAYLLPGGGPAAAGAPASLPDWLSLGDGHEIGPSILGLPAFVTDHSPALGAAGDLALADLRNYLIGDRMELSVQRSAAGSGFPADIANYRVTARVDGRYWVPGPVTPGNSSSGSTVSPVVVLGDAES